MLDISAHFMWFCPPCSVYLDITLAWVFIWPSELCSGGLSMARVMWVKMRGFEVILEPRLWMRRKRESSLFHRSQKHNAHLCCYYSVQSNIFSFQKHPCPHTISLCSCLSLFLLCPLIYLHCLGHCFHVTICNSAMPVLEMQESGCCILVDLNRSGLI